MDLILSPSAIKQLKKIGPSDKFKVDRKINSLLANPLAGKAMKGEYFGKRSLKAWPLRIIYSFNSDTQMIQIIAIDYRGDVYKN